jgi:hypothetical protein
LIREEDTDTNLILEDILNPNKEYKRILDIPLMRDEILQLSSNTEMLRQRMKTLLEYIENPTKPEDDFLELLEYCNETGLTGLYNSLQREYSMIFTKRILAISDERLI